MISIDSFLVFIAFYSFYVFLEFIKRKYKVNGEYTRKIAHVITGLGAIPGYFFLTQKEFIFVTCVFLLIFALSYKLKFFESIHEVERKTFGELTYPLGILVIAIFAYAKAKIFIYGILLLAIPDVVAYTVGKFKNSGNKKSIYGSTAYFVTALLIMVTGFSLQQAVLIAFILTIIEFISPYGSDNFTVPVFYLISLTF